MNNYIIPTTIIDNFFDDPVWIRNFALEQEYFVDDTHQWPGKRTRPLHELNPQLFNHIIERFVSVFYNLEHHRMGWNVQAYFQLVNDDFQEGWVHVDKDALISGVVYLNPNSPADAGTTIINLKYQVLKF